MRKLLTLILLVITSLCFGQQGKLKPFKMVIVSPDTAIIENALHSYIDTTVQESVNGYYALAEQIKEMFDSANYTKGFLTEKQFKEIQQDSKGAFDNAKKYKDNIKQVKYYQAISIYAAVVFQIYFNQSLPISTFQIIDKSKLTINNLKHIANSLKADYVVGYKNMYTENKAGLITMKLTTILFSKKKGKIVLSAVTTGDERNYGDIWTCTNPLSCLLMTTLKSSIESVAVILVKSQHE